MVGILTRFRENKVAIIADIEKMYFQIFATEDTDAFYEGNKEANNLEGNTIHLSSAYDPFGFRAPFLLRGNLKGYVKRLYKKNLNRDKKLPEVLQTEWENGRSSFLHYKKCKWKDVSYHPTLEKYPNVVFIISLMLVKNVMVKLAIWDLLMRRERFIAA